MSRLVAASLGSLALTLVACGDSYVPVCGDVIITQASGEQCDDGNVVSGDGCSGGCQLEASPTCGNATLDEGEVCDDGNVLSGDGCAGNCLSAEVCGNGFRDFGEACDDGDADGGDGCGATCQLEAACGNGVLEAGELCDDGNVSDLDACLTSCLPATCGDGVVQLGVEACDDGNAVDDDLCPTTCEPCLAGMGQRASTQLRTSCLLEFPTPATWADAEAACVGLGGHLARVRDLDESRAVDAFSTDLEYWLGLSDAAEDATFVWSDGSRGAFRRWAVGEPSFDLDEDCVLMYSDGAWNDATCASTRPYVCEVALASWPQVGPPGVTWEVLATSGSGGGTGLPSYLPGGATLFDLGATSQAYAIATDAWSALAEPAPLGDPRLRAAPVDDGLFLVRRSRLLRFDTALATWTELGTYGQRSNDQSMTEADLEGRVYAVESGWVLAYDTRTGALTEWDTGLGAASEVGLAYDPITHALWLATPGAQALTQLALGAEVVVGQTPALGATVGHAICSDRSGGIYVVGAGGTTAAWRYDVVAGIWTGLSAAPFVASAGACTVSGDGFLYVSDGAGALARLPLTTP